MSYTRHKQALMRLKIAIIMATIALGLIMIYGLDVATEVFYSKGFLPFNAATRGIVFGLPSAVLPIIAYYVTKKEDSQILGLVILITGIAITLGSVASLLIQGISMSAALQARELFSFGAVLAVGFYIAILGLKKVQE